LFTLGLVLIAVLLLVEALVASADRRAVRVAAARQVSEVATILGSHPVVLATKSELTQRTAKADAAQAARQAAADAQAAAKQQKPKPLPGAPVHAAVPNTTLGRTR
jgi:hypothetical protein